MKVEYNKLDVINHLMNQAIKMFFHQEDAISIHLLVSAANEILTAMLKAKKIKTALGCNSIMIRDEYRKEWIRGRKAAYNFFKHADKDTYKSFAFNDNFNILLMVENINFLLLLKNKLTKEETYFLLWMLGTNQKYLTENKKFDTLIRQTSILEQDFFDVYDYAMENIDLEHFANATLLIPT